MVNNSIVSLLMDTSMVNVSIVTESNALVMGLIDFLMTQRVICVSLDTYIASGKDCEVPRSTAAIATFDVDRQDSSIAAIK